jgi:hypothetical protein
VLDGVRDCLTVVPGQGLAFEGLTFEGPTYREFPGATHSEEGIRAWHPLRILRSIIDLTGTISIRGKSSLARPIVQMIIER